MKSSSSAKYYLMTKLTMSWYIFSSEKIKLLRELLTGKVGGKRKQ